MHYKGSCIKQLIDESGVYAGIYMITNKVNGKSYIGQAVDVYRRIKKHFWDTEKGNSKYMCEEIEKYGIENFSATVLEFCEKEELYEKEKYYIEKYHTYENGYNLRKGGKENIGWKPSEEVKRKLSENNVGGKSHFARKTICDGMIFDCAKDCARYFNIPYTSIKDWLSRKTKMPKEWYDKGLRYLDLTMDDYKARMPKTIAVVYKDIKYKSIREFCREENIDRNLIKDIRSGKKKMPQEFMDNNLTFIEKY